MNKTSLKLVHTLIEQMGNRTGLTVSNFTNDDAEKVAAGTLRVLGNLDEKWFVRIEGCSEQRLGSLPALILHVNGYRYNPSSDQAEALGVCAYYEPPTARYRAQLREDNLEQTVEYLVSVVVPEIQRVALEVKGREARTAEAQTARTALAARYGIDLSARRAAVRLEGPHHGELTLNTYAEDPTHSLGLNLGGLSAVQVDNILALLKATVV